MTRHCPRSRLLLSITAASILGLTAGCYERVVSAKGYDTNNYTIYKPASDDVMFKRLDRWIMGEPQGTKKQN